MPACHCPEPAFDGTSGGFRRTLWIVIIINAGMFGVEMAAGALAGSQALQADALDFLGDTLTYAISIAVLGRSVRTRANVALFKGVTLGAMGIWVLGSTAYQVLILGVPDAPIMGAIGIMALVANLLSVALLLRFRNGDANVRSVWLCSRNDAIGNVAVIVAAVAVYSTGQAWPDLIVAGFLATLFLRSSALIIRQAAAERRYGLA